MQGSRRDNKARRVATLALLAGAVAACCLSPAACSPTASEVGPGGTCFLTSDCAPGLVCVEQQNKSRICTDDLTRVVGGGPPEAGMGEAGDGPNEATDAPVIPQETGSPDTGSGQDTGIQDTGASDG